MTKYLIALLVLLSFVLGFFFGIRYAESKIKTKVDSAVVLEKIKDILIDQKSPIEERNSAYLVTDLTKKIIWLVKYKESQLSIGKETDKIQYILVYQNHELY